MCRWQESLITVRVICMSDTKNLVFHYTDNNLCEKQFLNQDLHFKVNIVQLNLFRVNRQSLILWQQCSYPFNIFIKV